MKKKYNKPSLVCVKFSHLCSTAEISMGGKTNHFDSRRRRKRKWEDDEELDEQEDMDGAF